MTENMQSFGPAGLGLFFQLIFSKVWDNLQDNNVYQNSKLLIHSSTAEIKLIYEQTDFFQDWQQRVRLLGGKTFFSQLAAQQKCPFQVANSRLL